jgi:hypothetical protein
VHATTPVVVATFATSGYPAPPTGRRLAGEDALPPDDHSAAQEHKTMASKGPDGRKDRIEDEFFHREDQRLIERMRAQKATESTREALSKASGITDPAVLDKLAALEIEPETVAALSVVPLVAVAWADGTLDEKERVAVLSHAGFAAGTAEHTLLEAWLARKPEPRLLDAWHHLISGIVVGLRAEEIAKMRATVLDRARSVAGASGGMLGLGSKVSKAEAALLAQLEGAFGRRA